MPRKKVSTRTNKSGKGDKVDAKRNLGDMAFNEVKYVPAQVKVGEVDMADYYRFNLRQFEFLRELGKVLDPQEAGRNLGIPKATVENWMKQERFRAEFMKIQEVFFTNVRMTAEHASAKHIKLMQKFEKAYDQADEVRDKASMAKALAGMSDSYMKATGLFSGKRDVKDSNIVINIDLSGEKKMRKAEVIDND